MNSLALTKLAKMNISPQKAKNDAAMRPPGEENVRLNPLRSKAILPAPPGPPPLVRRSFPALGAVLTGSLALGARPGIAAPAQESPPAAAPWSKSIGAGVVDRPYGRPADTE